MAMTSGTKDRASFGQRLDERPTICRSARPNEIGVVRKLLVEAIEASPYYSDRFKAFECQRLNMHYLEAMHEADPFHIMVIEHEGQPIGAFISGPELGTLWLYWSYVLPQHRQRGIAQQAMEEFIAYWDNGRFHKIATYTRSPNAAAIAVLQRHGFALRAKLEKHIFGEDYLLFERPLEKRVAGYDTGLRLGRLAGLKRRFRRLFGQLAA
jgi:RimJ/RimL family protein N-acetyltransferase